MMQTKTSTWDEEIKELEDYFAKTSLPDQHQLNAFTVIEDVKKFISAHLELVKANNGNKTFRPYLERLIEFKNSIENK